MGWTELQCERGSEGTALCPVGAGGREVTDFSQCAPSS
jgi:hypothetical protein